MDDPSHFLKSLREDKDSKGWRQGDLWRRTVVGDPFYFFEITETRLKKQGGIVTGEPLGRDNSINNIF